MTLSHSKMQLMLKDPMSYYIKYHLGISATETKPALALGSAVHWGLEHSTDNLDSYFNTPNVYTEQQGLAEAMVAAYLKHKDEIFNLVLAKKDGTQLKLLKETHELFINSDLASNKNPKKTYKFIGIADLLLETDAGLVLIDYKTSSREPDWNEYLEQIYRYIFMLKNVFPDKKVCKIGIINLRKASLRQKKTETSQDWYARMKQEYIDNESKYIYVHMFDPEELDKSLLNAYINNLSKMADMCQLIEDNDAYYINYGAQSDYGKSEYYDIFYKTPGAFNLYSINDTILDDRGCIKTEDKGGKRPCNELDIETIDSKIDPITHKEIINSYNTFRCVMINLIDKYNSLNYITLGQALKQQYCIDDNLMQEYFKILDTELNQSQVVEK